MHERMHLVAVFEFDGMMNIEFHVQLNIKCRNLVKTMCVHTHCLE